MKIVLCCAGGFSTTMLMDSMKKTVKDSAKLNIDDFQFTAIPEDLLQSEVEGMDVLVIGPQIAHKIDYIKPIIDPYHIPYVIVDKDTYGKMDGATVMKMALIVRRPLLLPPLPNWMPSCKAWQRAPDLKLLSRRFILVQVSLSKPALSPMIRSSTSTAASTTRMPESRTST